MNEESSTASTKIRLVRATSAGALAAVLGLGLAGTIYPAPAIAAETDNGIAARDLHLTTGYLATGIESSKLRYSKTVYKGIDDDGTIRLAVSQWSTASSGWSTDPNNPYAGHFILSFTNEDFYSQIESIQIDRGRKAYLSTTDGGATWTVPIYPRAGQDNMVFLSGSAQNYDIKIKLKNGQTLQSLGLADTSLSFESVWIKENGAIAEESISRGFISPDSPLMKNEQKTDFCVGRMSNTIVIDPEEMRINSVHTFKPNQNFLQTDYSWILYIKEQFPSELVQYIDTIQTQVYSSDMNGAPLRDRHEIYMYGNGLVDSSITPELSILQDNTLPQLNRARGQLDDIFFGTLGQSRNYTISYKLKDGVSLKDFTKALNELVEKNQKLPLFESWLESDYIDMDDPGVLKHDSGGPQRQLNNSYANSYLQLNDTDRDGIFDFVEFNEGLNITKVDTDGDGVPDNQEFYDDHTAGNDAGQYKVSGPTTKTTSISPTLVNTITGTMPKAVHKNPADAAQTLHASSDAAGNAVVKLVQAEEDGAPTSEGKTYATYLIPLTDLESGSFTLSIPAGTIPTTAKKAVLVGTDPKGVNTSVGTVISIETQAEHYNPVGRNATANPGDAAPNPQSLITNATELPKGTTYAWEQAPNLANEGDVAATIIVTYPDNSTDRVPVTIDVTANVTQAQTYSASGGSVDKDYGQTATLQELAATVTYDPKLAEGVKPTVALADKASIPTGGKNNKVPLVVTYPDGSRDSTEVTLTYGDASDAFTPGPQAIEVSLNKVPAAADGIANKDGLPKGTAYAWKGGTAPDTSAAGDKAGTVVVTYPDGTTDEVAVTVKVKSQAAAAEPKGKDLKVPTNGPLPEAAGAISNLDELPAGTRVAWKEPRPDTTTPGTKDATVTVTYPGGASKEVAVKVKVGTDAEANTPVTQVVKVQKGAAAPAAEAAIKNKDDLPKGTKIEWVEEPNTEKVGEKPAFVKVTYPDGTSDVVKATVKVGTDAEAATPEAKDVKVPTGGALPAAKDAIENLDELPKGTTAKWAEPAVDTTTPGNQTGKVEVTYPDGSKETVDVPVKVGTDAEVHEPKYGAVSTPMGTAPSAAAAVKNGAQLPVGTTYTWKTKPDTANPGTTKATVVVTYPDGSTDEGEVEITVTDTRPDSLKYEAAGGELTKGYGQTATLAELKAKVTVTPQAGAAAVRSIELPAGATIPTKGKDLPVSLVVNYADGTQDGVTVKLTYGDAADAFTPQPAPITVDLGTAPAASDGIANKNDLPTGTSYGWKNGAPDTSQPGAAGGTVVVTYPDGTTAEVPVTVTINDTRNEAEKHRVTGDALEVAYGTTVTEADVIAKVTVSPKPAEGTVTSIALADGVKIPTNGKGLKVPVKVTFSDGSSTTAEVTLTYGDANAANTPVAQPIEALVNSTPAASDAIANLADLPGGTTVAWKDAAPNTGKAGTVNATAVVTYPDGTTDAVPVTITVKTAADAYNPTAKDDVKVPTGGELPPAGDVIEGELPDGTTVVWKEPKPDTTKPGDQTGKVEVTYPDGSKETVEVPVKVGTDAELYDPTAKDGVKVDTGAEVPAATDVIEGNLPGGAKVEWTKEPDTSKPGNQTGIVKVAYPDGSSDVVEVPVKVGTDAEATDPKGQDVTVGEDGKLPDPTHAIANPGDLPDGTKLQWKDPKPDPTKPGEQTGTIVVTYPDGSTEELTVTVKVPEKADGNGKDAGKKGKGGKRGRGILPKTGDASTLAAGSLMGGGILASAFGSVLAAWKRRRRSE